jgi:hypothetical protein
LALIRKAISENKSVGTYTGLPLGMGTSVLLANYYISQLVLANFYDGVNAIRYEDDLIMFLDEGVDAVDVIKKLDEKLTAFELTRNDQKTEVLSCMDPFVFLGVSYDKGNVSLTEERIKKWKEDVKSDIHDEIRNYRTLELIQPGAVIPKRKEIVDMIWKQHKRGKRSYFHQHLLKIKAIAAA